MVGTSNSRNIIKIFNKRNFKLGLLVSVALASLQTANATVINKIYVSGNNSIDTGFILKALPIKVGEDVSNADINLAIKLLFAQGLFANVNISERGGNLYVKVKEQQTIESVNITGNVAIKAAALLPMLRSVPGQVYNEYKASFDAKIIEAHYKEQGYSNVKVSMTKSYSAKKGVEIVFTVVEGTQDTIQSISFSGNTHFPAKRLLEVLASQPTGLFSWLTHRDVYTDLVVEQNKALLKQFYDERGYADFTVIDVEKTVKPGAKGYSLVFKVEEGPKYNFGEISINSFINSLDARTLTKLVKFKTGETFSGNKIETTLYSLNNYLVKNGYPFAVVMPTLRHDFVHNTISVTYDITQGKPLYINQIDIDGNNVTHDDVIRRELPFNEGDAFNKTSILQAKRRLLATGFFKAVEIEAVPTEHPDRVNLVVHAIDDKTGKISGSVGYTQGGDSPGASVQAGIQQDNLFGTGNAASLSIGYAGRSAFNGALSFNKPHFLGTPMTANLSLSYSSSEPSYKQTSYGGSAGLSLPIGDNISASVSYNLYREKYSGDNSKFPSILQPDFKDASVRSSVSYALTRSTIDNYLTPRSGTYAVLQQEIAGLGGNSKFIKTRVKGNAFYTLSQRYDLVAAINGGAGYVYSWAPTGLTTFDMFKGNVGLIRGFAYNGIGPAIKTTDKSGETHYQHVGGSTYLNGTAEVNFPLPYLSTVVDVRGAVFLDAATLFNNPSKIKNNDGTWVSADSFLRLSAGISFLWNSPFGPIRLDYAWPIRKAESDVENRFSFGLSSRF